MNRTPLYAAILIFLGALGVSWVTHGTGVIKSDIARHIYVPDKLTMRLQIMAAYNERDIFFRYRWATDKPVIFHDLAKFEGGKWVRKFGSGTGMDRGDMIEDRVTMMVDDGSVPEFAKYGGYLTIGDKMRFFADAASREQVQQHPYLGKELKKTDVRKYLPATRRSLDDWGSVVPQAELDSLHRAGYFLDLWHWRAARSNPFGTSDDEYILAYRQGDAGKAPFTSNWDGAKNQPLFMLDRNKVGRAALSWDDITNGKLGFDDVYYISENNAVPFDASYAWKDGDTIPRLLLQQPTGSHGNIKPFGKAQWRDGYWDVTLQRAMDTGSPADDKIFADKGSYTIAVAVHRDAAEGRWHYVSMPFSLGLGRDAEIAAAKFTGSAPEWKQPWTEVTLFYPGQVSWPHLNSAQHAGAKDIKKGVPVKYRHSEEQLAYYGVEREFANEIRWQWLLTMIAGLVLIGAFGFALTGLLVRRGG